MNERQQSHIDYYLQRLEYWQGRKPNGSTARLLAARDADEAHPLRTEEEATEVVEYLWRLEGEQAAGVFTKEATAAAQDVPVADGSPKVISGEAANSPPGDGEKIV